TRVERRRVFEQHGSRDAIRVAGGLCGEVFEQLSEFSGDGAMAANFGRRGSIAQLTRQRAAGFEIRENEHAQKIAIQPGDDYVGNVWRESMYGLGAQRANADPRARS